MKIPSSLKNSFKLACSYVLLAKPVHVKKQSENLKYLTYLKEKIEAEVYG